MTIPCQVVLASSLYEGWKAAGQDPQSPAVRTGYKIIDGHLGDVVKYARLHCLSGEPGVGKSIFCLNIIVNQLLFNPEGEVTIVDATNSFNVPQLYALLQARNEQLQVEAASGPGTNTDPILPSKSEEALIACLEKVKVMQVFDFTGIVEALSEIRSASKIGSTHDADRRPMTTIIADSDDDSDAESHLDWPATQAATTQKFTASQKLILIQGLDRISTSLIHRDYVDGHSSMTSLLRSLSQLARSTRSCIIITNSATAPRTPASSDDVTSKEGVDNDQPLQQRAEKSYTQRGPIRHHSIFSSNLTAPTHGRLIDGHVDAHLLLSKLPKTVTDAEISYGRSSGGGSTRFRAASVVEVLLDRSGSLTGRWSAYEVADDGTLKSM